MTTNILFEMRSRNELKESSEASDYRELQLLREVRRSPETSQRNLSRRLGIALGLTNVLMRNLAERGYVRITQAGWRRWLYSVTPAGFSRKIRLTVAYIHRFIDHYRMVKGELREELALLDLNEESRIAIYGTGEFAELVYMGLKEAGIEEVDILAPASMAGGKLLGIPMLDVSHVRPERYDRVLISQLDGAEASREELHKLGVPLDKLVTLFDDGKIAEAAGETVGDA